MSEVRQRIRESMIIIDHNHHRYRVRRDNSGCNKHNGAYYYSREIVKNIIPNVRTDRSWITVNIPGAGANHAILFVHNNLNADKYEWIKTYGFKDVILVCGVPETCDKVAHLGTPIYLPLSIDTKYVEQFRTEKTKGVCYAGRKNKLSLGSIPKGVDILTSMKRDDLLRKMAMYEEVYAVGRVAIEAACLGCKVLPFDERFPDPSIWKVVDNLEAARMLQDALDIIDR